MNKILIGMILIVFIGIGTTYYNIINSNVYLIEKTINKTELSYIIANKMIEKIIFTMYKNKMNENKINEATVEIKNIFYSEKIIKKIKESLIFNLKDYYTKKELKSFLEVNSKRAIAMMLNNKASIENYREISKTIQRDIFQKYEYEIKRMIKNVAYKKKTKYQPFTVTKQRKILKEEKKSKFKMTDNNGKTYYSVESYLNKSH